MTRIEWLKKLNRLVQDFCNLDHSFPARIDAENQSIMSLLKDVASGTIQEENLSDDTLLITQEKIIAVILVTLYETAALKSLAWDPCERDDRQARSSDYDRIDDYLAHIERFKKLLNASDSESKIRDRGRPFVAAIQASDALIPSKSRKHRKGKKVNQWCSEADMSCETYSRICSEYRMLRNELLTCKESFQSVFEEIQRKRSGKDTLSSLFSDNFAKHVQSADAVVAKAYLRSEEYDKKLKELRSSEMNVSKLRSEEIKHIEGDNKELNALLKAMQNELQALKQHSEQLNTPNHLDETRKACLDEFKQLHVVLQKFLENFPDVSGLNPDNCPDLELFTKDSTQFADKLEKDLKQVYLNSEQASWLSGTMYQHLGVKAHWYHWEATQKNMDKTTIANGLADLFSTIVLAKDTAFGIIWDPEERRKQDERATENALQTQIFHIKDIIKTINDFPFRSIRTYSEEVSRQLQLQQNIKDLEERIAQQLNEGRERASRLKALCFGDDTELSTTNLWEIDLFEAISERTNRFTALETTFDNQKKAQDSTISSADTLDALTCLQQTNAQKNNYKSSLEALENEILKLEQDIYVHQLPIGDPASTLTYAGTLEQELNKMHNEKISGLSEELQTSVEQARQAVSAAVIEDTRSVILLQEALLNDLANAIPDLVSHRAFTTRVRAGIISLETLVTDCRNHILQTHQNELTRIKREQASLPTGIRISEHNPFRSQLSVNAPRVVAVTNAMAAVSTAERALSTTEGRALHQWSTNFRATLSTASQCLLQLRIVYTKADIIEQRLRDPCYRLCVEYILPTLAAERRRLQRRYAANDIQGVDNDPRIRKLTTFITEFEAHNNSYINENLNLVNSNRESAEGIRRAAYKTSLRNIVTRNLHYTGMETLSEGSRSDFIQWLRIHVLQPIQSFFSTPQRNGFFTPTALATQMERSLIDLGNVANARLTHELANDTNNHRALRESL